MAVLVLLSACGNDGTSADVAAGEALYNKNCLVCHATAPEYHKEGPSLHGIYGRQAGTVPFFTHYRGLKGSDVRWTEATLDAWLADPRAFLAGRDTSMSLRIADAAERQAIIAYIKTLN